ncbi:MAG TPA: DUF6268 family outer membrane beta-barrel protein [Parafilimonas sp.]|nr:DUF6268 family outer membrane beta-barrel protein [Parafilimonas sp.]
MRFLTASCISIILFCLHTKAQPYVDPLSIRYTHAFKGKQANATPFNHFYIGSDLPVRFKSGAILLISPFFESWNIDSAENKDFLPVVNSIVLPVGIFLPLSNKWSMNITAIARVNGQNIDLDNAFQFGGIAFASYKRKEQQKLRLGVYVNNDFFGVFVVPLIGVDWRIDKNNYLFGLLPGRLTYEHKLSTNLYTGATFRAITNSYRLSNGNYLRIDDNQLSAYLDFYPAKHVVVTLEPGYGIFRKLRSGNGRNKNYITDYNWDDGLFIKLSASYRIRL